MMLNLFPKKSRGYSYTVQEYSEHKDKIRELKAEKAKAIAERDEARAEVNKLSKKKVKIAEIENIEAKESIFGKKSYALKRDTAETEEKL